MFFRLLMISLMLELANFQPVQFFGCFGLVFPSSSPQRGKENGRRKGNILGSRIRPFWKGIHWFPFQYPLSNVEFYPKKSWHRFDTSFFRSPSLSPHFPIYTLWKDGKNRWKKERKKEGENYLRFHTYIGWWWWYVSHMAPDLFSFFCVCSGNLEYVPDFEIV